MKPKDDVQVANRAVLDALKRKPRAEESRRRWWTRGASIAGAIALGAFCMHLVWPLLGSNEAAAHKPQSPIVQREDDTRYTRIPDYVAATAPKSDSRLVLAGTNFLSDQKSATAMIGTDPEAPQTYRLGALLPNGAMIAEIHRDHVVLTRDGTSAKLMVTTDVGQAPAAAMVSGNASLASLTMPLPADPLPVNPVSTDEAGALAVTSPEYRDGRLLGVRLFAGSNASAFHALGLQNGDFLPDVDLDSVNASLRAALAGSAVSLRVSRGGTTQKVTLKPASPGEPAVPGAAS